MTEQELIMNFPITVYGNLEKYNETISKGRCRIFYKGRNRNGTYITPEFAEKLLSSAPYTPVKGIYDIEDEDYTDHGEKRTEGRIYGIVPENPNVTWEKHLDDDGVEREYACVDVLYFTALYPEAGKIDTKGQSMELYKDSIKGEWKIVDGARSYVFTDACFLGLQVLGDNVEPCFEGAAFYTMYNTLTEFMRKFEEYQNTNQNHKQGGNAMPTINFKISDGQKFDFLWSLLNPNFNEEGNWTVEYGICDVYEEYAVVRNYAEGTFERVYYTKNDETDSLEIKSKERCFIVDVNESEKNALTLLQTLNGGNYELVDEKFGKIAELETNLENQKSEYELKIGELDSTIATLNTEKGELEIALADKTSEYTTAIEERDQYKASLDSVTEEKDELAAYKKNIEDEAKKAIIMSYSEQLSTETIEKYLGALDSYSNEELDKELTYELKKSNPNLFTKNAEATPGYIPKADDVPSELNEILARYEKKN